MLNETSVDPEGAYCITKMLKYLDLSFEIMDAVLEENKKRERTLNEILRKVERISDNIVPKKEVKNGFEYLEKAFDEIEKEVES